ncbi:hypothetical protein SAMN05444172_2438 [Burkholderia sp. GAS332]|nr:hypothetical protein SAMN05444172_2438 [Burkholderia sp. GAS332]
MLFDAHRPEGVKALTYASYHDPRVNWLQRTWTADEEIVELETAGARSLMVFDGNRYV